MTKTLTETTLKELERDHPHGLTSAQILAIFEEHGVAISEATLRKYVQQGVLPRSVRVGQKGKHKGSTGLYPVSVLRRIVTIRELMARNVTIEEMKRDVLFARDDLDELSRTLDRLFVAFDKLARADDTTFGRALSADVRTAKKQAKELVSRLTSIEGRLIAEAELARAVG